MVEKWPQTTFTIIDVWKRLQLESEGNDESPDLFHDVSAGYDDESKHSKDRSNLDEFEAPNDIKSKKSSTYTAPSFKALIVMHPAFDVVGPNSEAVRFNPIFAYELNKSLPPNR